MDLTEEQWKFVEPLIPKPKVRTDGRGRPWRDPRDVLDGTLWVLRTGAPWKDLPPRYPPYQTCHRRFQQWSRDGTIEKILYRLARHLQEHGGIDITEAFIDGTFAGAKKGALRREGDQDHGNCRPLWPSDRPRDRYEQENDQRCDRR